MFPQDFLKIILDKVKESIFAQATEGNALLILHSISDLTASVTKHYFITNTSCAAVQQTTRELCKQITGYYHTFLSSQIIQEVNALKSQTEHLNASQKHFSMCHSTHCIFVIFTLKYKHKKKHRKCKFILFVAGSEQAT